jgi:predicted DsbA family dithiol-disulfide isomerase
MLSISNLYGRYRNDSRKVRRSDRIREGSRRIGVKRIIKVRTYEKVKQDERKHAGRQEERMEKLVEELTESEGFDSDAIESTGEETAEKASKMMETYLGEKPDIQEALEFLCLAEGAEVTHYEVLTAIAKDV